MNDPRRPQRFGPPLSGYGPTGPQVPPIRRPPTRLTPTSRRMHPRTAVTFPRRGLQEGPRQGLPSGPQAPTRPVRPNSCRSTGNTTSPHRADFPRRADSPATARAENAALVVVRRRLSRAARRRVGHRTGYRQRLGQKANRDRAVTPMPGPSLTRPTTTTPTPPSPSAAPAPTTTTGTPSETVAGAMQTVVYDVTGKAGQSASRTWIAATSYRPSSTSPCRGGKRSACQSRPCIPLASRSSTSATTSPARSPWPGFRYASAPGRG